MFDHLEHHSNMVNLTKRAGGKIDGVTALIVATSVMNGFCGFFLHIAHEDDKPADISDYANPTLAEYQAVHNHAYEA